MDANLTLEPLTQANWRVALEVRVTEQQLPHVADHQPIALVILAKAQVGHGGGEWEPLAIVADGKIVGVVGLTHRGDRSFMENLAIDHRAQRQGFGRASVDLALQHCAHRASTELLLTVHDDNVAARQMYLAAGFEMTGRRPFGDPEMRYSFAEQGSAQP